MMIMFMMTMHTLYINPVPQPFPQCATCACVTIAVSPVLA
jgi:hypothetical protein